LNEEKKKLLEEQYKQQVEAFNTQKALNIANAIIVGAQAAIAAFQAFAAIPIVGPALGIAAAAAVGVLTGVQVGLIASQNPPPPPKLAAGGIANNPGPGVNAIIGEAGPEAVLPLTDETFDALGTSIVEAQQGGADQGGTTLGGSATQLIINLDGRQIANSTVDLINNRVVTLDSRAIR
jgi:hypothetical protein